MVVDTLNWIIFPANLGSKRYDEIKGKENEWIAWLCIRGLKQKSGGGVNADIRSISRWTSVWVDGSACLAGFWYFREKRNFEWKMYELASKSAWVTTCGIIT